MIKKYIQFYNYQKNFNLKRYRKLSFNKTANFFSGVMIRNKGPPYNLIFKKIESEVKEK